jgi:hypothetical protein
MSERATVFERPQMGVESAPGTPVEGAAQITAFSVLPNPQPSIRAFRPVGSKVSVDTVIGKGMTQSAIEGVPDYNNLVYLLSSLVSSPGITTPNGGTLTRLWRFRSKHSNPDTFKTFTMQVGSADFAMQYAYNVCTELTLRLSPQDVSLTGTMIGQKLADGQSMTASPTVIPTMVLDPTTIDVFVGTSLSNWTQLDRDLLLDLNVGGRFSPVYALDSRKASFSSVVERAPTHSNTLVLEANAIGVGYMDAMYDKDSFFLKVLATGPLIEGSLYHSFQMIFAFKLLPGDRGDRNDVYGITYLLEPVQAEEMGGYWVDVQIQNTLQALLPETSNQTFYME